MKIKITIAIALIGLALTSTAKAAGPYDGIWVVYPDKGTGAYYSIHENNGYLVALELAGSSNVWSGLSGIRNGNTVDLVSIPGASVVAATGTVIFTSPTTITAQQKTCRQIYAGYTCNFPDGTNFQGYKVF